MKATHLKKLERTKYYNEKKRVLKFDLVIKNGVNILTVDILKYIFQE